VGALTCEVSSWREVIRRDFVARRDAVDLGGSRGYQSQLPRLRF
jgi:hypothetical protein